MTAMNMESYKKALAQNEKPVLVEFWAPWCSYCRKIGPAMERVAAQMEDSLIVGQVNIDDHPDVARREAVEVIPTLILYRGGKALGSIVAPESKARIESFIRETLAK